MIIYEIFGKFKESNKLIDTSLIIVAEKIN